MDTSLCMHFEEPAESQPPMCTSWTSMPRRLGLVLNQPDAKMLEHVSAGPELDTSAEFFDNEPLRNSERLR